MFTKNLVVFVPIVIEYGRNTGLFCGFDDHFVQDRVISELLYQKKPSGA